MTDDKERPVGKLFSRAYAERGVPIEDNPAFRRRLGAYTQNKLDKNHSQLSDYLDIEAGFVVPKYSGTVSYYYEWNEYFSGVSLSMVLDSITLIYKCLISKRLSLDARNWKEFVARVLVESNIAYELDEGCGVHPLVDHEFSHNKISTLVCLADSRYQGVRKAFEDAYNHFEKDECKQAIRSMFESLEILVRLMVECKNLSAYAVEKAIKPVVLSVYEGDEIAADTVSKMMDGFGDWVDSIHNYRHGQGKEEPVEPPQDFTVYVLSSGASYLRWLVGIDEATKKE